MPPEIVLATLRHVCTTLQSLNIPLAVMGGIAMSRWKHPRFTKDVDLLITLSGTTLHALLARLGAAGLRAKRPDPWIRLEDAEFVQLFYEPRDSFMEVQVDLLLANSEFQRTALERRIPLPADELGFEAAVLSCEDLIILKLLAGRMIDRWDAATLLKANRDAIDFVYLAGWVEKLGLQPMFRDAWTEAFAAEPPPI